MKRSEINSVFEVYQNIVETDSVIELTEESIDGKVENAVEFFYNEGINDNGIDLIVDDIGLDTFVEFVLQDEEFLSEERSATKAPKESDKELLNQMQILILKGLSSSNAAKQLAIEKGLSKNFLYSLIHQNKKKDC